MSTVQIKKSLIQYIDKADDRIVRAMYAMLQNYLTEEEQIIAYSVQGDPLTKKDMTHMLNEAGTDVENEKGLSSNDIRAKKENW